MKKSKLIYCILFFGICLIPLVGTAFTKEAPSAENRELAQFPALKNEEGINKQWLSEAGDYFQEHFGFRNELVTANALLNGKILGTSTASGVIEGTDGWLYYKDSLSDYLGTEPLSDRSLFNIAHSLSMMQEYLTGKGVQFLFTVAPNKNSLYGEHMPYYDKLKVSDEKNLTRLQAFLEEEQVPYTDLYQKFMDEEEVLYHKRDSHWNNKGAALAADTLLTALGKEHDSYADEEYEVRADFEGDLDVMLYPLATTPEEEIYFDRQPTFAYVEEVESNFFPRINTVNPAKEGSVVMYRDSFGNAILPFIADEYAKAFFTRGVPYQLTDVDVNAADTVIVERAERFLPDMAQAAPVFFAPIRSLGESVQEAEDGADSLKLVVQGPRAQITGRILPPYLETRSRIYVNVNGVTYEACPMDLKNPKGNPDAGGFSLYMPSDLLAAEGNMITITVENEGNLSTIYSDILEEESQS